MSIYESSVFADYEAKVWPHRYRATLVVQSIHGGTPDNPKVIEGWIKSKLADNDELIQEAVAATMVELGIGVEEATEKVISGTSVNRFKRDEDGLYIEGRTIKAAIKEASGVALAAGNLKGGRAWGTTHKGLQSFIAEHVQVEDRKVHLGVSEADRVYQKFVQTFRGSGISYEEEVDEAKLTFTVSSDWAFSEDKDFWAKMWVTGQKQGLGASRSQGFGTYAVTEWKAF